MIEVRAFLNSFEATKKKLLDLGSIPKGDYAFCDYIYQPKGEGKFDLNKEFLRIRTYEKNNWDQKKVQLVHKGKPALGVIGIIKTREEFDTLKQGEDFLGPDYIQELSFKRTGNEFHLKNLKIYIENIEGLSPCIEVLAPTKEELRWLFDQVEPKEIVLDSVPKLIQIHLQNSIKSK
jgi:adenylate cyclase class IV